MRGQRVYIAGAGIISPLGRGIAETKKALRHNRSAIRPLQLFKLLQGNPLPTGQVAEPEEPSPLPRTHRLARIAATQAMADSTRAPDVIILGTTTGGILTTEQLLRENVQNKELYRYHGLTTVAELLAREFGCTGPALTVSTACSSGAVAIGMALNMLRRGKAKRVLAGGVDSLCRLTYFGFNSLQLVDRDTCRPFDRDRQGMAVAEGAALLLLTTEKPAAPPAELLGAGFSCDAYHSAAPHPEGRGALMAMRAALADAGLAPTDISYINLHGTGTRENDLAESKAVNALFTTLPHLSSVKGATGHSLAASGAIEAIISAIAVAENILPANTGCQHPDPALGLAPLTEVNNRRTTAVLSNSFGFGGNNGSLVLSKPEYYPLPPTTNPSRELAIHGFSCSTGAGDTGSTLSLLAVNSSVAGKVNIETVSQKLPSQLIRRLKRLPRLTLSLATEAWETSELPDKPAAIYLGTGWGALSETYDFLTGLYDSAEQFPSPTDFVGSVHNGPAGQAAILFGSTGANITMSGGDYSFEQALLAADLLLKENAGKNILVIGVDEAHLPLSSLLDPSISSETGLAEGGGAFCISKKKEGAVCLAAIPYYQRWTNEKCLDSLIESLGGIQAMNSRFALILAGIPAADRGVGERQLAYLKQQSGVKIPLVRYRELTGEFASASAVASTMAAAFHHRGKIPGRLVAGKDILLVNKPNTLLVLGLGHYITAIEFKRP